MGRFSERLSPPSVWAQALRAGPGPYDARQSDTGPMQQSMAAQVDPLLEFYNTGISGALGMPSFQESMAADRSLAQQYGGFSPERIQAFIDSPLMPMAGTIAGVGKSAGRIKAAVGDLPMDEASRMARAQPTGRASSKFELDYYGSPVQILQNPSRDRLAGFLQRTKYKAARRIVDPDSGDVYIWDAGDPAMHQLVAERLGIRVDPSTFDILGLD